MRILFSEMTPWFGHSTKETSASEPPSIIPFLNTLQKLTDKPIENTTQAEIQEEFLRLFIKPNNQEVTERTTNE